MPKGHSARRENIEALKAILDDETNEGRIALAGLAMSYATCLTEVTGRQLTRRIIHLRTNHAATDRDVLLVTDHRIIEVARRAVDIRISGRRDR